MTDGPTTRERLLIDRDLVEVAMLNADPKDLAGLSREYRAILAALDALPDPNAAPAGVDTLKERRDDRERARNAGAGTSPPAVGSA